MPEETAVALSGVNELLSTSNDAMFHCIYFTDNIGLIANIYIFYFEHVFYTMITLSYTMPYLYNMAIM